VARTREGRDGILELAAAMKFLSNADLSGRGASSRATWCCAWIVIAVGLAVYLAGRSAGPRGRDGRDARVAVWLAAALPDAGSANWKRSCRRRHSPPQARTGELGCGWTISTVHSPKHGRRAAGVHRLHRLHLHQLPLDGSQHVPAAGVRDKLSGFVRARLYTDGQGAVYERQQRYQQERFATVALPLYAIVDANQRRSPRSPD
jgi:thiol:disulfide interchange protein DsbD